MNPLRLCWSQCSCRHLHGTDDDPAYLSLMDLMMPTLDGAETIHAIRERYPDIQVLMLTN